MDLPKNITQIGEADGKCKIYVEDYVVSFLKQLNPLARDKTMAAALYGRRNEEGDKTYFFVYGAGKLDFLQKETRHLSQAQLQEIERIRHQYFEDYDFVGYRILDGEMVDGFHICEQGICRFVSGYAQFYEKNDSMLTYMLEARQEEPAPELVDIQKYDVVRSRQEQRKAKVHMVDKQKEGVDAAGRMGSRGFQISAAAVFVLLCILGLSLNSSVLSEKGFGLDRLKSEFAERKLASAQSVDTVEETMEQLTAVNGAAVEVGSSGKSPESAPSEAYEETEPTNPQETSEPVGETFPEQTITQEVAEILPETMPAVAVVTQEPANNAYIVCKGDTLSGISLRNYGTENYVKRICEMNEIQNPDEIQIGQKILLP